MTVAPYRHHPLDDLAAYALDAVDDRGERQAIEDHLAACEPCRRLLADDEATLAWLVTDEDPPASVWAAIDVRTRGDVPRVVVPVEFGSVRAAPPATPVSPAAPVPPRGLRRRRLAALVAAAAALLAAVAAGPQLLGAGRGGGPAPGTEVAAPTLGVLIAADGAEVARVRAGRDGPAVELTGVALLPQGRTYQLWSLDGERPASLGLLGDGTDTTVAVSLPAGTRRVAISDEPAGGSPAPSGLIAGAGTLRPA
ncbi:MAG TPA: anti-sigma factor [Acidimicrobiales bacterium]|nr:anti-sigma factor [Acidimicrobiales bacterium]